MCYSVNGGRSAGMQGDKRTLTLKGPEVVLITAKETGSPGDVPSVLLDIYM